MYVVKQLQRINWVFRGLLALLAAVFVLVGYGAWIVSRDAQYSTHADGLLFALQEAQKACEDADSAGRLAVVGDRPADSLKEKRDACYAKVETLGTSAERRQHIDVMVAALNRRFSAQDEQLRNVVRTNNQLLFDTTVSAESARALRDLEYTIMTMRDAELASLLERTQANVRVRKGLIAGLFGICVLLTAATILGWRVTRNALIARIATIRQLRDLQTDADGKPVVLIETEKLHELTRIIEEGLTAKEQLRAF